MLITVVKTFMQIKHLSNIKMLKNVLRVFVSNPFHTLAKNDNIASREQEKKQSELACPAQPGLASRCYETNYR